MARSCFIIAYIRFSAVVGAKPCATHGSHLTSSSGSEREMQSTSAITGGADTGGGGSDGTVVVAAVVPESRCSSTPSPEVCFERKLPTNIRRKDGLLGRDFKAFGLSSKATVCLESVGLSSSHALGFARRSPPSLSLLLPSFSTDIFRGECDTDLLPRSRDACFLPGSIPTTSLDRLYTEGVPIIYSACHVKRSKCAKRGRCFVWPK